MGPFERVATYLSLVLLFPPSFLLRLDRLPFHTKMNSAESDKQHPESSPASEASELSPATTPSQEGDSVTPQKRSGRRKINIEFIEDKSRRHITFSKRKAGIMKKAYELSTLTGTQVLLLVASETGHVYTFATPKLQPLITKPEGKTLIQACLNATDTLQAAPNSHAQMSPGPGGYPQHHEHAMGMNQAPEYSQASPAQPAFDQHPNESDKAPGMPYGMQRFAPDTKSFQTSSPSGQDMGNEGMGQYYPSAGHMMPGMRNVPYSTGGPSLPTLSDRGSFSNLPSSNYQFPMGGNSYPSNFPSQNYGVSGSSQLFSKQTSNLPTLPPRNDM